MQIQEETPETIDIKVKNIYFIIVYKKLAFISFSITYITVTKY